MKRLHLILAVMALAPLGILAQDDQKGLEIAQAADLADQGFGDIKVDLVMTLTNKNGQSSSRELTNHILEQELDGDKSLIIFHSPRDVKGTSTLTYTHKTGPDDQWLYLPSIKRVKRISSDNKSGPFMGSEFAYEDLSSQEVEKYSYGFLGTESKDGNTLLLVERDPVDEKSGYTRQIVWYNQDREYRVEQVEFYDRKNTLLKTLTYDQYKLYLDKHWRAGIMHMVNHQTGKETILKFNDYAFQNGLTEQDFSQNSLMRAGH
jgi:outer membrane lipoprotein-sorting protein